MLWILFLIWSGLTAAAGCVLLACGAIEHVLRLRGAIAPNAPPIEVGLAGREPAAKRPKEPHGEKSTMESPIPGPLAHD